MVDSVSQFCKCNFLTPGSWSHQNALVIAFSLLHTAFGILKQENEYKGTDCRTEEIKVLMLAWDSNLAFQPWSFALTLSIRSWKSDTLFPLRLNLIPKYLLGSWTRFTWSVEGRDSCILGEILGEKYNSDLLKFIDCPNKEQYHKIVVLRALRELYHFGRKRRNHLQKECEWMKFHSFLSWHL